MGGFLVIWVISFSNIFSSRSKRLSYDDGPGVAAAAHADVCDGMI